MEAINVKLKKSVIAVVFISAFFYREKYIFAIYLAAAIHEWAHYTACVFMNVKVISLEVGIFGMSLTLPLIMDSRTRLVISAAGPCMSLLMLLYTGFLGMIFSISGEIYNIFVFSNLCMLVFNLLPISPLDGGSMLKSVLSGYFGVISGGRIFRRVSAVFCTVFVVIAAIAVWAEIFNPAMWVICVFLILGNKKERFISVAERKIVLSGELKSFDNIKFIPCDAESKLLGLAEFISPDYTLHIAAFYNGRFFGEICQKELLYGVNHYGALCSVKECIEKNKKI